MTFQPGNRYGKPNKGLPGTGYKSYRCLYCKKRFTDVSMLPSHESSCPFRTVVRTQWAAAIATAKRRELDARKK